MQENIPTATLKAREERRLLRGHLWAYRNEFQQVPELPDGALVDVFSESRRFVGRGFYQREGGIAVRLLCRHQEEISGAFFQRRLQSARALREQIFPGADVYRWIFGESDGLPGLAADRYGSVVSAQSACAFYETHAENLAALFLSQPGVSGVLMRMPSGVHRFGEIPETISLEVDGVQARISLDGSQKTGMFLDQRLNCAAVRGFAKDARVLDGHCYIGLWSCHAALAGAASVLGVDTSARAVESAAQNAMANDVTDRCRFECAAIETMLEEDTRYDVVVLDPPAFAKTRPQTRKALARYHTLNAAAMKAIEPGGILITSSCSHFVEPAEFLDMLKQASASAQRRVWLLEMRGAAPDHPVLLAMPETAYLKCAILRVF